MNQAELIDHSPALVRPKLLSPTITVSALQALGVVVGEMHVAFVGHVARQHGPGGFMKFVALAAPRYVSHLEELYADHLRLARALGELRVRIMWAGPSDTERLAADANALADAIAAHDHLEWQMLEDALEGM